MLFEFCGPLMVSGGFWGISYHEHIQKDYVVANYFDPLILGFRHRCHQNPNAADRTLANSECWHLFSKISRDDAGNRV